MTNGGTLTPKNWTTFQHYRDRRPSWIKLHKTILDDPVFNRLPLASQALAPKLWLLASEYEDGSITLTFDEIAFRLRTSQGELEKALEPLLQKGYFTCSNGHAQPEQSASLEKEKSRYKEEIEWCEKIYAAYPRKVAKPEAIKAIRRRLREGISGELLLTKAQAFASVRPDKNDGFTPHPATWFNQERYNDDPDTWKDRELRTGKVTQKDVEQQKRADSLARLAKAKEELSGQGSIQRVG